MHYVDQLLAEADAAIAAMRSTALTAVKLHARAELMRHMRTTAAKVRERPRDEAVAFVTKEWMAAWGIAESAYPGLGDEMRRFTSAFCADSGLAEAVAALEAAFAEAGLDLADQMAWRSTCAHGWWGLVQPAPDDVARPAGVPVLTPGRPFWEAGCAAKCR